MKRSTRKIIGILGMTLGLSLLVFLVPNAVLRNYLNLVVLAMAVATSVFMLGWAKPRSGRNNLVRTLIILAAITYQVIFFTLLGMKLGFVENVYNFSLVGILTVILPTLVLIVLEEVLRGQLVERGKNSRLVIAAVTTLLIMLEIIFAVPIYNLNAGSGWFGLCVIVALPSLLKNILLTYIAYYYSYQLNVIYRIIMEMPIIVLPIWPEVGEYLAVLFQTVLVVLLLLSLISIKKWGGAIAEKIGGRQKPKRLASDSSRKVKRYLGRGAIGVVVLLIAAYAALMSGLFKYHFLAIGSGSMEPNLSRGDMVPVKRSKDYGQMAVGDVLIYRYSNVVMVHRIYEINEQDGVYTFVTKGDANEQTDNWVVSQGDVIGLAKGKIAMFGFPTLWLNELFNKE